MNYADSRRSTTRYCNGAILSDVINGKRHKLQFVIGGPMYGRSTPRRNERNVTVIVPPFGGGGGINILSSSFVHGFVRVRLIGIYARGAGLVWPGDFPVGRGKGAVAALVVFDLTTDLHT